MYFDRTAVKREVRKTLSTTRPRPVLVTLLYLLTTVFLPVSAVLIVWFFAGGGQADVLPAALISLLGVVLYVFSMLLSVGYVRYSMKLSRGEETFCGDLLDGFGIAGCAVRTVLLVTLRIMLWLLPVYLLLMLGMSFFLAMGMMGALPAVDEWVVTAVGIAGSLAIACFSVWLSLRYALTFYFLLDAPEEGARAAVCRSVDAMRGQKWNYLKLTLSFVGWMLLVPLTFGLLGLWLTPYLSVTYARFYDNLSGRVRRAPPAEGGYIPFDA